MWQNRDARSSVSYEELTSPELAKLEKTVEVKMRNSLDLASETKKELLNSRMRLDRKGFEDEIGILDKYLEILGKELELEQEEAEKYVQNTEIAPPVQDRALQDYLKNLFQEMTLDLGTKEDGVIAVSGFTTKEGKDADLLTLLDEMAVVELSKVDTLRLLERDRLDAVLREQELAHSDLTDTSKAIEIGKLLTANYIVTGSVIGMPSSVIIFSRIINVETGEVESAAQVIVPRDRDVESML